MKVIKKSLLFVFFILLSSLYNVDAFLGISREVVGDHEFIFVLVDFCAWLLLVLFFAKKYKKQLEANNPRDFKLHFGSKINFLYLLFAFLIAFIILNIYSYYVSNLPSNQVGINTNETYFPILQNVIVILFSPVLEELVNRGLFFNMFFNKNNLFNKVMAVIVSGLVFGFLHEHYFTVHFLMYSSLGWILAILYEKTKSIYYPIMLHMLINIL